MTRRTSALVIGLWLLLGLGASAAQEKPPAEATAKKAGAAGAIRHVIIISVDGLMPAAYTNPDTHGLKVPTLREMVKNGAWSRGVRGVFPTVTYPSHTSIATGTNPGTHGILTNAAWDPLEKNQGGWRWYTEDIRMPTLWDAARGKGLRTALLWWPVTVGAQGTAVVAEIWRASVPEDRKLARALATRGLLDAVARRFPRFNEGFTLPEMKNEAVTDAAVHVIETLRPHLLMMHILEVDHWQHENGPWSAEAVAAVENADRQVARLVAAAKQAGIWKQTALVVVSDHGFARYSQRVRPGILLREKGLITADERNRVTDWKAVVLSSGGTAYLYVRDPADHETRRTLVEAFRPRAGQPGSGIGRLYTQEEIRELGGDPEAFLAIEAAEGFAITGGYTGDYISQSTSAAGHGFDPRRRDMEASLLIYRPGIAPGEIQGARLIDVAPTVARWLGLTLHKAEGKPLKLPRRGGDH